jgi:hypothetical protein
VADANTHNLAASRPPAAALESRLRLFIIFTGARETAIAARAAGRLVRGLGARVTLLVPRIVPFPLPLDAPDVAPDFVADPVASIARDCGYEMDISVFLCRDPQMALRAALEPRSLVILATRGRWWPDRHTRLARALSRDGHSVLTFNSARPSPELASICPHR